MRRLTIALWMVGALAAPALADEGEGMPLDATHFLFEGETVDPLAKHADVENIEGGKYAATAHSRLEAEGKISVKDEAAFNKMKTALMWLAANPREAEKVLGAGWNLKYTRDADYRDVYLDDKGRTAAKNLAGIRKRTVNGEGLELNVKPPGGLQSGPGGMILTRPELGMSIGKNADLKGVARSDAKWNPMRPMREVYGGDPANLMEPSIANRAKRTRFSLGNARWQNLVDVSADHVYDIKDVSPGAKPATFEPEHIFGLEADLNHPGRESGLVIPNVRWEGPHKASDVHIEAFHQDEAVQALHEVFPKLANWLKTQHGVDWQAALPKYTQAALNLKVIKRNEIKRNKVRAAK